MTSKTPEYAWMNGEIVPWREAKVHVRSEGFMSGANVFEGIRAYASPDKQQLYIFRIVEHMDRLFNSSMKILRMRMKWTADDLTQAIIALLRVNSFHEDVHIRPTAYLGPSPVFGPDPAELETGCVITAVERSAKPSLWNGIDVCVSSWRRIDDESQPPRVKAAGNYLNSLFAMAEARKEGYQYVIMLNRQGKVSEGAGACVMMVRHGKVITPPITAGILESVTRATLIELCQQELGIEVVEREVDRTELYIADEVFLCGTGSEVQPINSIDKYMVGKGQPGPVVKSLQEIYFNIARGQNAKYSRWVMSTY